MKLWHDLNYLLFLTYIRAIHTHFWIKKGNPKIKTKTRNTTTTLLHDLKIWCNSRNKITYLTVETRVSRQTRTVVLCRVGVHAESTMQTRTGVTSFHLHLTVWSYEIRCFKHLVQVWAKDPLSKDFHGFIRSLWVNVWPINWNNQQLIPSLLLPMH